MTRVLNRKWMEEVIERDFNRTQFMEAENQKQKKSVKLFLTSDPEKTNHCPSLLNRAVRAQWPKSRLHSHSVQKHNHSRVCVLVKDAFRTDNWGFNFLQWENVGRIYL